MGAEVAAAGWMAQTRITMECWCPAARTLGEGRARVERRSERFRGGRVRTDREGVAESAAGSAAVAGTGLDTGSSTASTVIAAGAPGTIPVVTLASPVYPCPPAYKHVPAEPP